MRPEYANTYGIGHGGVVAALVDMATGVALRTIADLSGDDRDFDELF
jgi:acyl-coenzyme A thioesterase PaaI-like protein